MVLQPDMQMGNHVPGEAGIWVLISGDIVIFSMLFIAFAHYRGQSMEVFQHSQAFLNQTFGLLNTILMLTSSWFVATGVNAARNGAKLVSQRLFLAALVCGLGFLVLKGFEYGEKVRAGLVITTDDFFMFYYVLSGVHALHVLIGTGVLIFMLRHARSETVNVTNLESGAMFWHLVDLLWIVLFALLYLAP